MPAGLVEISVTENGERRRELCATSWSLQGLGLPRLPKHWSNIVRKGHMAGWPRYDHPLRRGAYVYPVSCLPQATLDALRERGLLDDAAFDAIAPAEIHEPAPLPGESLADDPAPPVRKRIRRNRICAIDADREVHDFILGLVSNKPHINARHVMEAVTVRLGKEIGLRTVQRWLKTWKETHRSEYLQMVNPDRHRGLMMPAVGSRSEGITRPHQVWELDATPTDVMLAGGRHMLMGVLDVFTRRARILVVKTSTAMAVSAVMRRCMIDWDAVPELIKIDNGKEFVSDHIGRVCSDLKIERKACNPHNPQEKPFIERFFKTFSHDLIELLPSFVGHNVAERQNLREQTSFADRIGRGFGKSSTKTDNRTTRTPAEMSDMTAEQLQAFCDQWCETYEAREHGGIGGLSPRRKEKSFTGTVRRLGNPRVLDILLAPAPDNGGRRHVQKKGVKVGNHWFISIPVGEYIGDLVNVRLDPVDAGRIYCFDLDMNFLFAAENTELTGADRAAIARGARRKAKEKQRRVREWKAIGKAAGIENLAADILAARATTADKLAYLPTRGGRHETEATRGAHVALDADTGLPVQEITPELEAAAARQMAQMDAARAERAQPRAKTLLFDENGRPLNGDDVDFYRWVEAHPEKATDADRVYVAEMLERPSFRLLIGIDEEKKKAARAAS
ncbi:MAG: transposase [Geminicoccaceae bacterium]|nr:transposase [Geminicoccaceae bacterium]